MTTHSETLALIRARIAATDYSVALQIGRAEVERGCDSSALLVLMSTAAQLGEGLDCSLDEIREWLERAVKGDPQSVDALLELGFFLDVVADASELAIPRFENAIELSMSFLSVALAGLRATGDSQDETMQERVQSLRERATKLLSDT
jgi:hypothetical protein